MFLGLRTVIHPAPDLDAAKQWWTDVLGFGPYFDEPYYVGYDVGGYELGLLPEPDTSAGPRTYWGVANADEAMAHLLEAGATVADEIAEPGDGIRIGGVMSPGGLFVGIIENPHFAVRAVATDGPGL